jgi:hypothetical protein
MDDLIAQLGSIRGARVWYSFSGIGGYSNLHKLSYSKLLELARRHSWHLPYDIKEPIQLTKTEALDHKFISGFKPPSLQKFSVVGY